MSRGPRQPIDTPTRQPAVTHTTAGVADRVGRRVEQYLRRLGGPRVGVVLLLAAALTNAAAALAPAWRWLLDSPPYLVVVGGIALSGIATVAVRGPAAWREWRRPTSVHGSELLVSEISVADASRIRVGDLGMLLAGRGYRIQRSDRRGVWQLAGVQHGWSRFAGIGSHLSMVVLVVGAAIGTAFAEETRFGLFPGEQSLLGAPRPAATAAMRFDRLDATFDETGRPVRFDTHVTFLDEGASVSSQVLRVNEPADFAGHLVHAWTYGPAVAVRITDLGGGVLFDGWVALGDDPRGNRAPFVELPQLGATVGFEITDAATNTLAAIGAEESGRLIGSVQMQPGDQARLGQAVLRLGRFGSYVSFMSRRDPGVFVVFGGAALMCATLAAAFYWPRRRIDLAPTADGLRLRMRPDRFDDASREFERLRTAIHEALA